MQATTSPERPAGQLQENVVIFIDYSALLLEGAKTYPNQRFDVGCLYDIVLRRSVDYNVKSITMRLYGPTPPSDDTIWKVAGLDIETLSERETWTMSRTDSKITADFVSIGVEAFYRQISTTFIIVLGDTDLPASLEEVSKKYCCQADIWLWKSVLAYVSPESERGGLARVLTLDDYIEDFAWSITSDSTGVPHTPEDEPMDQADRGESSDSGFVEVSRRPKKDRRTRCYWRRHCSYGLACKYTHSKEEENDFKIRKSRKVEKYRFCWNQNCERGSRCPFAHSEAELFCPTCDQSGAGHEMQYCPERFRYAMSRA
jgi:hypothetical protein